MEEVWGPFSAQETRTFLVVQLLRHRASTAGDTGSIPGRGTKIPHAAHSQKNKRGKKETKKSYR